MAAGDLTQADFDLAFGFSRSEAAPFRDGAGAVQTAAVDEPRFDHDAGGAPLGLKVAPGSDLGTQDRLAFDALMLPATLASPASPQEAEATVFHIFRPEGSDEAVYRAWYSRDVKATIDTLLRQHGHHEQIGVIAGFRENLGGFVRYRAREWHLANVLETAGSVLTDGTARPLITAGAEFFDG